MQDGFFQKLTLSLIIAAALAGLVEFYKVFINGADTALNGKHSAPHVRTVQPGH